eukprot:scaffold8740_cov113-Cylindrotheca_fusiformis.AAC.5
MGRNIRYDKEVRQIGAVMLILSLAVMIYPLNDATSRISLDISEKFSEGNESLNWALLVGDLCVTILGLLGMAIGFMAITECGIVFVTVIGLIWEQTVFIDWIGKMYELSEGMYSEIGNDPSSNEQFFFSMGILKMFFLGFLLYGSLGLTLFNLYAFQTQRGHTKNAGYYRKRLGSKVYLENEDDLPVTSPIISVVGQPITHPEITVANGVLFTLIGMWGMARGFELVVNDNRYFQLAVGFSYVAYVATIILTEFSIGGASGMSSTAAVMAINGHIILAYLDQKAGTVPEEMDEDYYHDDAIVTKNFGQEQAQNQSLLVVKEEEIEAEGMA